MNDKTKLTLNTEWTTRFMVKMRNTKDAKAYKLNDFQGSFITVGQKTGDFQEILRNISLIPQFPQRLRGILTLFREDIQPVYEDPKNNKGIICRIQFYHQEDQFKQAIDEFKLASDKDKEKFKRKIAPSIDNINQFVNYFILLGLCGGMDPVKGQLNGMYIKTENYNTCIDFWYDKDAVSERQALTVQFKELLSQLDNQTSYDLNGETRKIFDSFQTIDAMVRSDTKDPYIRGVSQYKDSESQYRSKGEKTHSYKDSKDSYSKQNSQSKYKSSYK